MNCFDILGIEPTDNVREIKRAYAEKSREVHPEEHPLEFERLHEAYEEALKRAKSGGYTQGYRPIYTKKESPAEEKTEDIFDEVRKMKATSADSDKDTEKDTDEDAPKLSENLGFDKIKKEASDNDSENAHEDKPHLAEDLGFDEAIDNAYEEYKQRIIALTEDILGKLEFLSTLEPANSDSEWIKVMDTPNFKAAAEQEFFIYHLTEFAKSHNNLPKQFYISLAKTLNFKELSTREQKGMYEELYKIALEKKVVRESDGTALKSAILTFVSIGLIAARNALSQSAGAMRILKRMDMVPDYVYIIFVLACLFVFTIVIILDRRKRNKGIPIRTLLSESIHNFKRFYSPSYRVKNRRKPRVFDYFCTVFVAIFSFVCFMEFETWWVSALFALLCLLCILTFVYLIFMSIIIGILKLKDKK